MQSTATIIANLNEVVMECCRFNEGISKDELIEAVEEQYRLNGQETILRQIGDLVDAVCDLAVRMMEAK